MAVQIIGKVVGDSAYEVAVKNGFAGTEVEWLATLKGEQGDVATVPMASETVAGKVKIWVEGDTLYIDTREE